MYGHRSHTPTVLLSCALCMCASLQPPACPRVRCPSLTPRKSRAVVHPHMPFFLDTAGSCCKGCASPSDARWIFAFPTLVHSPLLVQADFGAMGTLTHANCCSLLADFGYLCAAYIPQDWTLGTDLAPTLASVCDAVFFGAASPIRLVLLVPTQMYCRAHDLHALPLIHTTLATGRPRTSPHDMTLVVLQNHATTGTWPGSQALCTAHVHPILTNMRLRPHSLPSHLKLSHLPDMKCHASFTRIAPCTRTISLAVQLCGKSVFWCVWNQELQIRRELMRQPQLSWPYHAII